MVPSIKIPINKFKKGPGFNISYFIKMENFCNIISDKNLTIINIDSVACSPII